MLKCEVTNEECNEPVVTDRFCAFCLMKKIYVMLKEETNDKAA